MSSVKNGFRLKLWHGVTCHGVTNGRRDLSIVERRSKRMLVAGLARSSRRAVFGPRGTRINANLSAVLALLGVFGLGLH
ncbi:hypothetical protein L596_006638 [Steinernema carpocapsae]|uniref:Uncharacterized protein n=1 Tax=Steinernema carpocapsae TaxID=34508 RepID=A0A4U8V5G7_STECR|nr:hypothetical protein L596_006638 [Steinernema carpocapsae]